MLCGEPCWRMVQMPITSPGCHLCFWQRGYRSECPTALSLGLINLLEQLTELGKTFYLPDYGIIIKRCNSGTARWKRCVGQSMGKRHRASMLCECSALPTSPCVHQSGSSLNPVLFLVSALFFKNLNYFKLWYNWHILLSSVQRNDSIFVYAAKMITMRGLVNVCHHT